MVYNNNNNNNNFSQVCPIFVNSDNYTAHVSVLRGIAMVTVNSLELNLFLLGLFPLICSLNSSLS